MSFRSLAARAAGQRLRPRQGQAVWKSRTQGDHSLHLQRASSSSASTAAANDPESDESTRLQGATPPSGHAQTEESSSEHLLGPDQDAEIRRLLEAFGDETIAADNAVAGPSRQEVRQRKKTLRQSDPEKGDTIEDYSVWEQYAAAEVEAEAAGWSSQEKTSDDPSRSTSAHGQAATDAQAPSRALNATELGASLRNHLDTLSASTASKAQALRSLARERTLALSNQAGKRARGWRQDLEKQLGLLGGRINGVTGYDEVERMKEMVREREDRIAALRETAAIAKAEYDRAVTERSTTQRDIQLLLERKDSWDDSDVLRFTKLVRSGHAANLAVSSSKEALQSAEANVERAFDALMKGILERYHEEQVWSDKIRSVSTYGSLAVLVVNLVVFLGAITIVEPWKRRRLVRGLEERVKGLIEEVDGGMKRELEEIKGMLSGASASGSVVAAREMQVAPPETTMTPEPIELPEIGSTWPTPPPAYTSRALEWTRRKLPSLSPYLPTDPKNGDLGLMAAGGGFVAGALATTLTIYLRTTR